MLPKTIQILPIIYCIEVTTHSNNHTLKSMCLDCLSKSKTNKEYIDYQHFPSISSVRICCKCHAMTIEAVIATFDIPKSVIIQLIERKEQYRLPDDTITPTFEISPIYLAILKKELKNGKTRQRHSYGER